MSNQPPLRAAVIASHGDAVDHTGREPEEKVPDSTLSPPPCLLPGPSVGQASQRALESDAAQTSQSSGTRPRRGKVESGSEGQMEAVWSIPLASNTVLSSSVKAMFAE